MNLSEDDIFTLPSNHHQLPHSNYYKMGFVEIPSSKRDLVPEPLMSDLSIRINTKRKFDENQITKEYLNEREAKEALNQYVSRHFCYGRKPLKHIKFNKIQPANAFRYILQTFTETRYIRYVSDPYNPYESVKLSANQPDNPWDLEVKPKILFNDEVVKIEIPNTSQIENCENCSGVGSKTCNYCHGYCTKLCWFCNGTGYSNVAPKNSSYENLSDKAYYSNFNKIKTRQTYHSNNYHNHQNYNHSVHHIYCTNCNGRGSIQCTECSSGQIDCSICNSTGRLKWYIQLEVTFKNNEDDFLQKYNNIPDDLLLNCLTKQIYFEQNIRLEPVRPNEYFELTEPSKTLINTHLSKYAHTRILAQRHYIHFIPVALCSYTWKNRMNNFYVYGIDQNVYYPDYPNKCCCTLM